MTTFNINQITNNTFNDINPQISESGNVVWESDRAYDFEISYYNNLLQETTSLTSLYQNETQSNPQIYDDLVVYEYESATNNQDIYLFQSNDNGGSINSVATTANNETNPQISGDFIVYEYEVNADNHDIYLIKIDRSDNSISIDSRNTTIIANTANNEINPQIAGNFVVYETELADNNSNIYLYEIDSGNTTAIANQINNETLAHVSETGNVVYEYEVNANNTDIKFYDYLTGNTTTLAGSTYDELNPKIAGNYVTWQAWDGNDWEIYRYNSIDKITTQVTNNTVDDTNSQISEIGYVVWEENYNNSGNIDLKFYNGSTNLNLANSSFDEINPQITGNYLTWQAWDGNDWEVYAANIVP